MRRIAVVAFLAFCTLFLAGAQAWAFTPPAIDGPITDPSHKLSDDDKQALAQKLLDYKNRTTNEVAYFIAPSLNGEDIEDVGYDTGQAWQLGAKGKDNGVLVVLAPNERRMRIEVGKGLEGDLTDLQTQQIIQQIIGPHLKQNDFRGAIDQSADAIIAALGDAAAQPGGHRAKAEAADPVSTIVFVLIIVFVIYLAIKLRGGGRGGGGGGPFWFGGGGFGGGFDGGGGGFGGFGGGGGGGSFGGGGGSFGGGGSSGSY